MISKLLLRLNDDLSDKYNTLNSTLINKQDSLIKITPMEQDFNNLTSSGWYWINPTITTQNPPLSEWGLLEVCNILSIIQRFTTYSVTRESKQYVRMYANNEWTPWSLVN